MAENIIGVIHDGFIDDNDFSRNRFDFSDERFAEIVRQLEVDRDSIIRILAVIEGERMKAKSQH